jgi:DNA-3-methyladenine glycosylase II
MLQANSAMHQTVVEVPVVRPYDFAVSLSATKAFRPTPTLPENKLNLPVRIGRVPVIIEVTASNTGDIKAVCRPESDVEQVSSLVQWVLFAELDLHPFYQLVDEHPKLSSIVNRLLGLKPTRPASLFEMAITVITEQQISLASAYHIRNRLIQRFGEPVNGLWVFPEADVLASASPEGLRSCGLSKQKADYIQGLARRISEGDLDLDNLKQMRDEEAKETIMGWPGFGRWSSDYMLVRGLARPDCVPIDDIGIRDVIGRYLGDGMRVTPDEAAQKLEDFRPYRGLLAFYLLAYKRLNPAGNP